MQRSRAEKSLQIAATMSFSSNQSPDCRSLLGPALLTIDAKDRQLTGYWLRNGPTANSPIRDLATSAVPEQDTVVKPVLRKRVLIVDDNRDLAESLAMVLRLWGHEVTVAFDGSAALESARARPPEIVFLDIGLPRLDGFQVARQMRANPTLRGARIVAISGYGREEDRQRSREAGIDLHLTKPVDPSILRPLLSDPEPTVF
jgi:CheY-like chemotaxis protein